MRTLESLSNKERVLLKFIGDDPFVVVNLKKYGKLLRDWVMYGYILPIRTMEGVKLILSASNYRIYKEMIKSP